MKLSEVVNRINGNVDRFTTDLQYYIGGEHFDSNELVISRRGILKENLNVLGFKFHFAFQERDVIFMARNPHLRKAGMVFFSGLCSDASYIVRTKDENVLSQEYLACLLQTDHFWEYCESHKVGSVNFAINYTTFANYEFDLPPIEKQREIAAKAWAAYRVKESYRQLLATTDDMLKAKFNDMFGKAANQSIRDIAKVVSGKSIPTKLEDIVGNVAYVKVADFNLEGNEKCITTSSRFVTEENANLSKMVPVNSILFAKNGAAAMSNKKRLTKIDCCIDMNTLAIIPDKDKVLPEYLLAFFESINVAEHVRQGAIPSIAPKDIENIALYLPSMEEQQEFAAIATQAEATKASLRQSIDAIDRVIRSLINQ